MFILQIQRREVESHRQGAMRLHLDLACVKLGDTQKKFEETTKKLEKKVKALEKRIHYFEEKCESFTWRIDGFSEVLRKAKSGEEPDIESSPFYIYGYKCKISINPNGYNSVESHLSVYLIIMKGEYDATLTWPFDKKFTFTLIDQQENEHNRENIVKSITSNPKLSNFARPVKEENIGRGYPQFVSHEKLYKRRYIVDDTIFVQVHFTSVEY